MSCSMTSFKFIPAKFLGSGLVVVRVDRNGDWMGVSQRRGRACVHCGMRYFAIREWLSN